MNRDFATLQIVHSAGGGHHPEDAGWGCVYEHSATMVVADGASVRLSPIKSLQPMLDKYAPQYTSQVTPSGVASRLIRDTVAQLAGSFPLIPLDEMILQANQRLADELIAIYGELSSAAILKHEPHLTLLEEDARYLRLALPVSTYSVARADWHANTLEVVQGADAAVFILYQDGRCLQITPDQMAQHDEAARKNLVGQPDAPAQHPFFRQMGDNRSSEVNRLNGIYHNYVGPDGEIDQNLGVSVVDGLPQIANYMFQTQISLDGVQAVLVTSDGMFWPSPLDETPDAASQRIQAMGERITRDGLEGYLRALRAQETHLRESGIDPHQKHDDATGLLLTLGK